MEIKTQIAVPSDAQAIVEFERKCFPCVTDRFSIKNIRYQLISKTCRILIIKDESNEICALVTGFLRHFKIPSGRVYKIGVFPYLQKKGIGSMLLKNIEKWFKENNMTSSYAEVRKSNIASRSMFMKNNYTETGTLYGYYGSLKYSIELEDGIKYKKNL